jgi:exopolysaccharide production protein ExoQ
MIYIATRGMAAFLTAIILILSIALVLHWGHKREQGLMPYIYYPFFLILALSTLLSERNLYLSLDDLVAPSITKHPLVVWATRANSLFILFTAGERIARRFLYSGYKPDAPILMIAAFWVYFLSNIASSAFLGEHASISHEYLYAVIAGSASLLCSAQEGDTAVRAVRNALFIFIILSALTLAFHPELVLLANYKQGLFYGFNIRYFGLCSDANGFGPLIVVFLISLWNKRYSAYWVNFLGWTIGLVSLVLTQSKTSWLAMTCCTLCMGYFRHGDFLKQRILDFRRPQLTVVLLFVVMLSTTIIGFVAMFTKAGETIYAFFETSEGASLLSLSARSQVWEVAVQEWHRNPLFGYGLTIWDERYRAKIGIPFAVSAHSQFYQSLSSAGIVGVAGLAIYAMTLFRFALKTAKSSEGLSMALFIMLFLESISETPLSILSWSPELMLHLFLLMIIAAHLAPRNVENFDSKTPIYKFISSGGVA